MTDTLILDAIDAFLARDVAPHVHALEHATSIRRRSSRG